MTDQLIILIIIGTASIMFMVFALVFFVSLYRKKQLENQLEIQEIKSAHQEQMLTATVESIEEERARIGTELHDSVGAMLSSIKMNLSIAKEKDEDVLKDLNETIQTVRTISHQMMPIVLKKYGLKEAIKELGEKVKGINVRIAHWSEISLSEKQSLLLFRIVQESLNNTLKHSGATDFTVSLSKNEGTGLLELMDNGSGFPKEALEDSTGMGLLNIQSRAEAIKAKTIMSNSDSGGACIKLAIPID